MELTRITHWNPWRKFHFWIEFKADETGIYFRSEHDGDCADRWHHIEYTAPLMMPLIIDEVSRCCSSTQFHDILARYSPDGKMPWLSHSHYIYKHIE